MARYKYLIIILILFIIYNSFFINKALHIDDPFTISIAREVNANFLRPALVFFSNPPFLGYYYAPIIRIFGENESWLHIFYFFFSILAIVSMFFLSLRFSRGSLIPVLFLISTPAFIISSQSIMLDIPLLAFFLASVAAFIYGIDKNNDMLLILSGLFTAVASLTKYSGLILIPILFTYGLLSRNRKKTVFLIIPVLIFFLWNLYCIVFYKRAIFFSALCLRLSYFFLNRIGIRALASLSFLSGTSIVTLFLIPFLLQKKKDWLYFSMSLGVGILPFTINEVFGGYSIFERSFLAILFIASTYIILLIIRPRSDKDSIFLSSWFILTFIFTLFTNFIAARFLLLLLPPLFLFIYNELSVGSYATQKNKIKFIILIAFIFSTVLAIGDYQSAGAYRDIVYSLRYRISLDNGKKPYLFQGNHYTAWGYAYYLKKSDFLLGMDYSTREKLGKEDDILITPTEPVLPIVIERKPEFDKFLDSNYKRTVIGRIYYRGHIFLHHRRFKTGFYCHDWGLLPFSLSIRGAPLEVFEIYKLSYSAGDKDES